MKAHPAYPVSDQGAYHHSWKLELPMSFKSYENLGTALSVCPVCCSGFNDLGEVLSTVSRALVGRGDCPSTFYLPLSYIFWSLFRR